MGCSLTSPMHAPNANRHTARPNNPLLDLMPPTEATASWHSCEAAVWHPYSWENRSPNQQVTPLGHNAVPMFCRNVPVVTLRLDSSC